MNPIRKLNQSLGDDWEHLVTIAVQQGIFFLTYSAVMLLFVRPGSVRAAAAWEGALLFTLLFVGWAMHRYGASRGDIFGGMFVTENLHRLMATLDATPNLVRGLGLSDVHVAILRRCSSGDLGWAAEVARLAGYGRRRASQLTQLVIGFIFFGVGSLLGAWAPAQFPGLPEELQSYAPMELVFVVGGPLAISLAAGLAIDRSIQRANQLSVNQYRAWVFHHWDTELTNLTSPLNSLRSRSLRRLFALTAIAGMAGPDRAGELEALGVATPPHRLPAFDGHRRWFDRLPNRLGSLGRRAVQKWNRVRPSTVNIFQIALAQLHYGVYLSIVLPPLVT